MRAWFILLCASILGVAGCQGPDPLEGLEPGEKGRVVRVIDGDALVLDTGQSVRLIAIEAPAPARRDRAGQPFADEASRIHEDLALGREVQLFYSGLTRDRYDRALAHVVTIDASGPRHWLNMELVKRGAARVRLYPDTAYAGADFLTVETEARQSFSGLWELADYSVLEAANLSSETRGFHILEARLGPRRAPPAERIDQMACQRRALGADLMIEIARAAETLCAAKDGTQFRLRGWVSNGRLDLTLPLHAEALD